MPGEVDANVPCMDLFLPKCPLDISMVGREDDSSSHDSVDVDRIRRVARTNAFALPEVCRATLWLLPSFINHSCTPNACWMTLGNEFLFVRAARHLSKGEEITISYMENVAMTYSERAGFCRVFRSFECRCERCIFERTLQPFTRSLEANVPRQLADVWAGAAAVESLEWVLENCKSFKQEKEKHWLRTSFAFVYLHLIFHTTSSQERSIQHFLPSLETILTGVQSTLGGSELVIMQVRQILTLIDPKYTHSLEKNLANMYYCLYGKQQPSSLQAILVLRQSRSASMKLV